MALNITQAPPLLSWSCDPVVFRVQSDTDIATENLSCICTINIPDAGFSIRIPQKFNALTFIKSVAIDTASWDPASTWSSIGYGTASNFIPGSINIADLSGLQSYLNSLGIGIFSVTSLSTVVTISITDVNQQITDITLSDSSTTTLYYFTSTVETVFDISEYLNAALLNLVDSAVSVDFPVFSQPGGFYKCNNLNKKYTVTFTEVARVPATETVSVTFDDYDLFVVYGGVQKQYLPLEQTIIDAMDDPQGFLTPDPDGVAVTKDDQPYLYFYIKEACQVVLNVSVYDQKGDLLNAGVPAGYTPFDVTANTIYRIPVGYTELAIEGMFATTENPVKYTVVLTNNDTATALSKLRTYYIDNRYYAQMRKFVYLNSRGGFTVLHIKGNSIATADYTSDTGTLAILPDQVLFRPQVVQFNTAEQYTFKITTAYRSRAEIDAVRDFVLSPVKYEFSNGFYIRINVISKKTNPHADKDFLFAETIEYQYAYKNNVYNRPL